MGSRGIKGDKQQRIYMTEGSQDIGTWRWNREGELVCTYIYMYVYKALVRAGKRISPLFDLMMMLCSSLLRKFISSLSCPCKSTQKSSVRNLWKWEVEYNTVTLLEFAWGRTKQMMLCDGLFNVGLFNVVHIKGISIYLENIKWGEVIWESFDKYCIK